MTWEYEDPDCSPADAYGAGDDEFGVPGDRHEERHRTEARRWQHGNRRGSHLFGFPGATHLQVLEGFCVRPGGGLSAESDRRLRPRDEETRRKKTDEIEEDPSRVRNFHEEHAVTWKLPG